MRTALLVLLIFGAGCAREGASLVDHDAWTVVEADADPFDDRPETVDCSRLAWAAEVLGEEPTLEVDTTACDYLSVSQPALTDVRVGETVEAMVWHSDLVAAEDAEAHVAVAVAGAVWWEVRLPIPAGEGLDASLQSRVWEAEEPIAEGAEVVFHLHNHGQNSYNLIHVRRVTEE